MTIRYLDHWGSGWLQPSKAHITMLVTSLGALIVGVRFWCALYDKTEY